MISALFLAASIVPATGVDEPPRRGTFTEVSLGSFTTLGGSATFSNLQPYISMTLGREIGAQAAVFASLGIGAASASCYQVDSRSGDCLAADSFGATFVEAGVAYGYPVWLRTLLSLKLVGGFTDLSPGPVRNGSSVPDHLPGFHLGAGGAIDYDTHLDHFAVGFDLLVRYTLARYTPTGGSSQTLGLPSLALIPRIRYVF
ncbi:MAG: adventurous gliding motility protein CglE [Myxococcales bacterium]|nr:adventurous gliding motility protein CglE [Myxococcales bacterium]